MIILKSDRDLEAMRPAGVVATRSLHVPWHIYRSADARRRRSVQGGLIPPQGGLIPS